jgi:FtsZ-binding cell division protein ZapB
LVGANEHVEEENQQILFSHVESQVVKNSRLNAENEELKQQLEALCKDSPATSDAANLDQPTLATSSVPTDEHGQLSLRYEELSKKYQDLSQKIKYLERKNTAVMQKNKDMKESVRAWQEYADRQSGKQRPKNEAKAVEDRPRLSAVPLIDDARPSMPSSPRSVATIRTPPSFAHGGHSSPAPMPPLTSTEHVNRDDDFIPIHHLVNEKEEVVHQDDSVTPKQLDYGRSAAHQSAYDDQTPVGVFSNMNESTLVGGRVQPHLRNNLGSSQKMRALNKLQDRQL